MESQSNATTLSSATENSVEILLKSLVGSCKNFIELKEVSSLSDTLKRIFYHGLSLDSNGLPNIRRVFGVLDFLNAKTQEDRKTSFEKWLVENIDKGKLTNLLSFLFSDTEHIRNCYEPSAFVRSERLQNALMTCMSAIETNQKSLIEKIDGEVVEVKRFGHRRTSSHPEKCGKSILSRSRTSDKSKVECRPWKSLTDLRQESLPATRPRSNTIHQRLKLQKKVSFKREIAEEAEEVPYFEYKVPVNIVNIEDIKIHTDCRLSPEFRATSAPQFVGRKSSFFSFLDQASEARKISASSISTSPSERFFDVIAVQGAKIHSTSPIVQTLQETVTKRKSSKQNLAQILQTINNSSRTKVALDRENAHFLLSEAIIATSQSLRMSKILEVKCKKIPEGNLFSPQPPARVAPPKFIVGPVDDDSESSVSTESSSDEVACEVLPHMEWNNSDPLSAESIAMVLMTKFRDQRLPNPKNLMWLVNESQAPQQLLPFPDSFPINPDETFSTFIRGSKDWAPPRQQIIFTVHPPVDRRRLLTQQNFRCAGCGMKVARAYVGTFRYCDYLGKFFCSACHKNQKSAIPARVLDKWDFSLYSVSCFAYKWLEQIWNLPLFHVMDLRPQLYEKAKPLMKAKQARLQLKAVQEFIQQCRFAEQEKEYCKEIPVHWTDDVDIWSMNDFVDVQNNVFVERIQEVVKQLEQHIVKNNCELCMARGFICELCPNKRDTIFPWQPKVFRCISCGSCYHEKCYIGECSKCERLKRRKRQLKATNFS